MKLETFERVCMNNGFPLKFQGSLW